MSSDEREHRGAPTADPAVGAEALDEGRLAALRAALGGDGDAADRFVADFLAAWPVRWTRLFEAALRGDAEEVRAALLSIRSTSAMLGASRLEAAAQQLLDLLREHGAVDPDGLDRLRVAGLEVCAAIDARRRGGVAQDSSPVSR